MGAFVLGILVGWLAEWVFYTFWVKGKDNDDCSSLRSELAEKKREISTLEGKLESATSSAVKPSSSKAETVTSNTSKAVTAKTQSPAKKATATTAKKPAVKKAVTKKNTTTKAATKKPAPAKKSSPAKKPTKAGGDDFTKLSGIGPSMAGTLKDLGIDTYTKLAATDDDILRDMLEASGARLNNNKEAMDSWNEQATLAAKGDFAGLKKLQAALKK